MTFASRLLGSLARLPAPRTREVSVERDLEVKMPDGVVLRADRWYPTQEPSGLPVVLARSPYGRREVGIVGRLFAERGFQAVIQSCRGTFGSGGEWVPFRNEREDGRATLDWLAEQPWAGRMTATFGPSYLGLTQWALAEGAPEHLRAMAPSVTASHFRAPIYLGDAFALETGLTWVHQVEHQELPRLAGLRSMAAGRRVLAGAYPTLPLADADERAVGRHVDFFQDWLRHDGPDDPWWEAVDFAGAIATAPPTSLVGGWYDLFLLSQVADYERLVAAGREARITIGPWAHTSPGGMAAALRDGIEWSDVHLRGRPEARRRPVKVFVMGSRRWVEADAWPPPADEQAWHLHTGGRLDPAVPVASPPDRYRYDPADPTPGAGGPSLDRKAGARDQRVREARADVLCFTSDPLPADLTVVGPLSADIHLRASADHVDYVVRLCDLSPKGRSINLSDGFARLRPEGIRRSDDGSFRLHIELWPTANTFKKGHCIRLQVSSGAFPLVARNTGSDEPLATATTLVPVDHEVLHDPDHPSAVHLPVERPGALHRAG